MLGQPISMLLPQVVGFKLHGQLPPAATATDLVLTVTEMLRQRGVVSKFVEFYGPGLSKLPLADRATLGNMSPEFGSTCAIFPPDAETLRYLELTGRPTELIELVDAYSREQGYFHTSESEDPIFSDTLELDLDSVVPSIAGPKRPQDRIALSDAQPAFVEALQGFSPDAAEQMKSDYDKTLRDSFPASDPPGDDHEHQELGEPVPAWTMAVPGVTSISADVHKYGYTFKGASVVLYRSRELLEHQFFWYDAWPGGLYASGTSAGTRPAAPIAGAWAAINHLGVDGYVRLAEVVRDATRRFRHGIAAIDGLRITHEPDMSLFEFGADPDATTPVDIGAVGDVMDDRGWNLDRQQGGLHLMVSPYHARIADEFLADLAAAVADHGESRGSAASYGGVG